MKSNNSDSVEVNPSPNDYKTPANNKPINNNSLEEKAKIKHCLFSRLIIQILFFSYIIGKINFNFKFIYSNIPLFTIYKLEIHRLITNAFLCESLYELIIGVIMVSTIVNNFENKEGTILFFFKFLYNCIISQIMLLIIYYLFSFIRPITLVYRINCREFLCTSFLVKHLLTTETKKIENPYLGVLNDRFVIVFFLLIYFFLNYEYRIENILCLYYGFIMCKYKKIFNLEFLSYKYINYIETSNFGKILKVSDFFVSIQNIPYYQDKINYSKLNANKKIYDINDERIGLKADENGDFII